MTSDQCCVCWQPTETERGRCIECGKYPTPQSSNQGLIREIDGCTLSYEQHAPHYDVLLKLLSRCRAALTAHETSLRPGEMEQLRRIDRAARAFVDNFPSTYIDEGNCRREWRELNDALFDAGSAVSTSTEPTKRCQHDLCKPASSISVWTEDEGTVQVAQCKVCLKIWRLSVKAPCEHRNQRQGEIGPPYCADCGSEVPFGFGLNGTGATTNL